jgi:hypothetical protein
MRARAEWMKDDRMVDGGQWVIVKGNGHLLATMAQKGKHAPTLRQARMMAAAFEMFDALCDARDALAEIKRGGVMVAGQIPRAINRAIAAIRKALNGC